MLPVGKVLTKCHACTRVVKSCVAVYSPSTINAQAQNLPSQARPVQIEVFLHTIAWPLVDKSTTGWVILLEIATIKPTDPFQGHTLS